MAWAAVFRYPALHPAHWETHALAAGLRPPVDSLSGIFRAGLWTLYHLLPPPLALLTVRALGILALGVITGLVYDILRLLPGDQLRNRFDSLPHCRHLQSLILMPVSIAFALSPAVYRACQSPNENLWIIFAILLALRLTIKPLRTHQFLRFETVAFLLGLLAGDGPFAIPAFVLFATVLVVRMHQLAADGSANSSTLVIRVVSVQLAFAFTIAALGAIAADYLTYRLWGGAQLSASVPDDLMLSLIYGYLHSFVGITTPWGWAALLFITVGPLVFMHFTVPTITNSSDPASSRVMAMVALVGLFAASQACGIDRLQILTLSARMKIGSDSVLAVATFMNLVAAAWAMAGLTVAAYIGGNAETSYYVRYPTRLFLKALAALLLVGSLLPRTDSPLRSALALFGDYQDEVVRECARDRRLVTDGEFDAALELAAWRQGRTLRTLSLVSGADERSVRLRTRDGGDAETLQALEFGGPDALRYWMDIEPGALTNIAVQLGFERRNRYAAAVTPRFDGLVAHLGGEERPDAAAGIGRSRQLARALIGFDGAAVGDAAVYRKLGFLKGRLAHFLRIRHRLAADADPAAYRDDLRLAEALDGGNPLLAVFEREAGWQAEHHGALLLTREGLHLTVAHGDFDAAQAYAASVLKHHPDDAEANFAIGMYHLLNRRYACARPSLLKTLELTGENAAVLVNLAVLCARTGETDAARAYARRAQAAAPGNAALGNAVRQVLAATEPGTDEDEELSPFLPTDQP